MQVQWLSLLRNRQVGLVDGRIFDYLVNSDRIQLIRETHASSRVRMNSAAKFAFHGLLVGSLAFAQAPTQKAPKTTSALVSPESHGSIEPLQPVATDPDADTENIADPASVLPDLPPVPQANATLIGGTIERLDRVRDQVTVRVFGGGRTNILFDPRTHIYREGHGIEASISDLHEGQRVYLDTILDGSTVFARSIRFKTDHAVGETQGILLKYRADRGELTIRDAISPSPVQVRMNSSTRLTQSDREVPASVLTPGSLIAVRFSSERDSRDVAREISILALPGTRYTFSGQVMHLDLRTGLLVLSSTIDRKTYEIYLDPLTLNDALQTGALVTLGTTLQDSRYVAHSLTINSPAH
jgi:hypothetical protein